mgnify:FL=1
MERDAVRRAFRFDIAGSRLPEVFVVWSIADDRRESVGRDGLDIGRLDLPCNGAGLAKSVDAQSTVSDRVERDLQVADIVVLGLRQLARAQVDLQ